MRCLSIADLPEPPPGKTGWPWHEESARLAVETTTAGPWPRISIVTPSFNQADYLEETIRSVLLQGYPNLQYIVIDGGSTDATIDILRKYDAFIDTWISEPDRGQSHAINKGLALCDGEIFNWINSDDLLSPGALVAVAEGWSRRPGHVVAGTVVNFDDTGHEEPIVPHALTAENFVRWQQAQANHLSWHQPGIFIPLALIREIGGVRETLHYEMDYLLMIDLLQRCDVTYIPDTIARFRLHESSKTVSVGINQFRVFRLQALRSMRPPPCGVSSRELRDDHARALIWSAYSHLQHGRLAAAAWQISRAWTIAPLAACSEGRRKNVTQLWKDTLTKGLGRISSRLGRLHCRSALRMRTGD